MIHHTRLTTSLLLSVLVTAAALAEPPAKTYLLKQKYTPGTYYLVMRMSTRQKQAAESSSKRPSLGMNIQQVFVMKMIVGEPDAEGNKTMTITYERIQHVMKMAGMVFMEYDSMSSQGTNVMMAQCFAPLLKAKISAVLDKEDTLVSVSGFDTIWDEMQEILPAAKPVFESVKKSFNEESLKKLIRSGQEELPDKPVAVGESWTNEQKETVPMGGEMTIKTTMTLASVEEKDGRKIAMIDISGTAECSGGKDAVPGPIPMKIDRMDMQQKGRMQFDIAAGQMPEMNMQMVISMAMSAGNPMGETSEPISMDMKMESEITLKQYVNEEPPEMTPPAKPAPASAPATPVEE